MRVLTDPGEPGHSTSWDILCLCEVVDPAAVERATNYRLTITGEVAQVWEPRQGSGIEWVGLVADDTGQTKVTVWSSACQAGLTSTYSEPGYSRWREPALRGDLKESDRIRVTNAKRTWHNGRANLEVDRHAEVAVIEGGRRSLASGSSQWADRPTPPSKVLAKGVREMTAEAADGSVHSRDGSHGECRWENHPPRSVALRRVAAARDE